MAHLYQIFLLFFLSYSCQRTGTAPVTGAARYDQLEGLIKNKSIAIAANNTAIVGEMHLLDYLITNGVDKKRILKVFSPEHGFRGTASDGELIENGRDAKTGVPVISLYGKHKKPVPEDLKGVDIVLFDIQDVGVRFYTYISTLHYIMEACAENNVKCIILDRPNPNGFYIDGNILDTAFSSFVGMHPVPVVHGMTVGEYGMMINGEGWLAGGIRCDLTVIQCLNYDHTVLYELPVRPSPNLPNQTSVYLYPSLCFFEGTNISVGRGTTFPFQVYGSPLLPDNGFSFTPESVQGAINPPLLGIKCNGMDLRNAIADKLVPVPAINLELLLDAYRNYPQKDKFFIPYFDVLAAGPTLREQIQKGMSSDEIRATWQPGLEKFMRVREKYLLYE
jgi:uncharacterized protein YbbC (DUF1343 family)